MDTITVKFKKLHEDAIIPQYQTKGAAGFDFHAIDNVHIPNGLTTIIKTGLSVEIPEGYELQIRSRSGLATKYITVANSPGTIDSDYRGEIGIILVNNKPQRRTEPIKIGGPIHNNPDLYFTIKKGDRIAQGVIAIVPKVNIIETTEDLSITERGEGGFGSTNK